MAEPKPAIPRAEFEARLRELVAAHDKRADNLRCVECVQCERCVDSTFCRASKLLVRCHYCTGCERCTDATHCTSSRDLLGANHCVACERCTRSSYLVRCSDMTDCTYCFGCVGLVKKDFHILNEPYDRSSYFAITSRLARELGLDGDGRGRR